jgi:legumain
MEDSDLTDLSEESLADQFKRVKKQTNMSHVHQFGPKTVPKEIVGNFQSNYDQGDSDEEPSLQHGNGNQELRPRPSIQQVAATNVKASSAVNAHDVDLVVAFYKYLRASSGPDRRALADALVKRIQTRESDDVLFEKIHALYSERMKQPLVQNSEPEDFECQDQVLRIFEKQCGQVAWRHKGDPDIGHGFTGYSLKYAGVLTDLCESSMPVHQIESILKDACAPSPSPIVAPDESFKVSDAVFDPELILLG